MQGSVGDKTVAILAGKPVFWYSLQAFIQAKIADRFIIVYRNAEQRTDLVATFEKSAARGWPVKWVRGGRERQDSVIRALTALPKSTGFVHIHDCARPLVRPAILQQIDACVRRDGAAVLSHRITDTVKRLPAGADPIRRRPHTLDRDRLWGMETPQSFRRDWIEEAYSEVNRQGLHITDDTAALELATEHRVTFLENTHPNPKITRPSDLAYAEFLLAEKSTS